MDYLSLLLPISYLILLIGSLATFSHLYRKRQARAALSLEPWFPPHTQRNIYLSLLELQSSPDTKVPDTILRAALLRRAVEDIHRLLQLRTQKPALVQLLQRGSVGDDLYKRFQAAEKEMELELKDVVQEANALAPLPSGANPQLAWGNTIFASASEMAHREGVAKKLAAIEARRAEAKQEWETRRKAVSSRFLESEGVADGASATRTGKGAEAETAADTTEAPKTPMKNASSDEDTVLVEAGGPAETSTPGPGTPASEAGGGGGTMRKKKKGKK